MPGAWQSDACRHGGGERAAGGVCDGLFATGPQARCGGCQGSRSTRRRQRQLRASPPSSKPSRPVGPCIPARRRLWCKRKSILVKPRRRQAGAIQAYEKMLSGDGLVPALAEHRAVYDLAHLYMAAGNHERSLCYQRLWLHQTDFRPQCVQSSLRQTSAFEPNALKTSAPAVGPAGGFRTSRIQLKGTAATATTTAGTATAGTAAMCATMSLARRVAQLVRASP